MTGTAAAAASQAAKGASPAPRPPQLQSQRRRHYPYQRWVRRLPRPVRLPDGYGAAQSAPKGDGRYGKTDGEDSITEEIRKKLAHEEAKKHIGEQKSDMWSGFAAGFWKGVTCGAANLNKSFQSYEAETRSQVSFWEAYNKNEKAGSLVGSLLLSAVIAAGITKAIGGAASSNGGGVPSAGTSGAGGIGAGIGAFGLSAELQLGLATAGMTIAVAAGAAIQQASENQGSGGTRNGINNGIHNGNNEKKVSKNKIKHIYNRHNPNSYAEQIKYKEEAYVLKELEYTSFFNKDWSAAKIEEAVNVGYKEALEKGISSGNYVFTYDGESVTVILKDGSIETAFGNYRYTYQELLALLK